MTRRCSVVVAMAVALLSLAAVVSAQELRQSIFDGDLAGVSVALTRRPALNAADATGWTALMNAAAFAKGPRAEIVKALLDAGAALEAVNDQGDTALIAATRNARLNTDVVALLLERGARVSARRKDGRTALMSAAFNLEVETIAVLLKVAQDVNVADSHGDTALLIAMGEAGVPPDASMEYPHHLEARLLPTIDLLIKSGANPNARNKQGETAMTHLARWESMTHGALPAIGERLRQAGAK